MADTGYWMNETSGVLKPAVHAFLRNEPMAPEQIAAMRAYLRQWIAAPTWRGERVAALRAGVNDLASREAIHEWLRVAELEGIDPL